MDLSKILSKVLTSAFNGQAWRSVYTCDPTQDLFDDLVPPEQQSELHTLVERSKPINQKQAHSNKEKPFVYFPDEHQLLSWPAKPWTPGRWGDGATYAVWYGSLKEKTSLLEVIFHLNKKASDDFLASPKTQHVVFHRQIYLALVSTNRLADIRACYQDHSEVLHSEDYEVCNAIGRSLRDQRFDGIQSKSARDATGENLCLFERSALLSDKKIRIVRICFFRDGGMTVTAHEEITHLLFPN